MIQLDVWLTLPDASTARVGELACTDADAAGRFQSEFAYAEEWLRHPQRFALDPVSLPVGRGRFLAGKFEPPLGIFDDALPDDWGRALIVRSRQLPREQQGEPYLLRELADHGLGLGALAFARPGTPPAIRTQANDSDLAALAATAEGFEAGTENDPDRLRWLFAAGSSIGGARPKALLSDASGHWIAKLPSAKRDGRFDVVGLETVGLDLARGANIAVPDHHLMSLGGPGRALLVRRFDVLPGGGRRHMISLRTLCRERAGIHVQAYTELAEVVRKVSAEPQEDVRRLFQLMAFNAALGNTDDHLKNFWMVRDSSGYRLSEAFDLVPDVGERREHVLVFACERAAPTRAQLLDVAQRWGVAEAGKLIDAVVGGVDAFAVVARAHGVPVANIDELTVDIERRLALLALPERGGRRVAGP